MSKEEEKDITYCYCAICAFLYKNHCLITGDEMNEDDDCPNPENFMHGVPQRRIDEARRAGFILFG